MITLSIINFKSLEELSKTTPAELISNILMKKKAHDYKVYSLFELPFYNEKNRVKTLSLKYKQLS